MRATPVVDLGGAGGASRDTESNYGGENAGSATVSALQAGPILIPVPASTLRNGADVQLMP